MAAGLQATMTTADVNAQAGSMARELNVLMNRIQEFQLFLAATDLKLAPYNMTSADEASIKSTFTDLDTLRAVYKGTATQAAVKDFRAFAKSIYGFGL